MPVLALTGGIGSGKSAAASILSSLGLPIVDLDVIAHQITAAGSPAMVDVAEVFGPEYLTETGALHRPNMRQLVFVDAAAREKLNAILHPIIYDHAMQQLQVPSAAPYRVLVIPLLVESPRYRQHIDHVLLIDCDEAMQVARVMQRGPLSETQAWAMVRAQATRQQRLAVADTVVMNDGNLQELHEKIADFHKNYIITCIDSK